VVAHSAPGVGATFTVTMQAHRTEAVTELSPIFPADGNDSTEEPYVTA
jgi:hypothetical protein